MSSGGGGGSSSGGSVDAFARTIAKMTISQLCEVTRFHALQQFVVETLTNIVLRYPNDLWKATHSYANLFDRLKCNALDVVMAMEDLGLERAAETFHCVSSLGALCDVMRFM